MLALQEHSCWWQSATGAASVRAVEENAHIAAQIRDWLASVMAEKGITVTEWAKAANVARTTIARPLKEGYPFVTSSRTLGKLAQAVKADPPAFVKNSPLRLEPAFLPVLHRVQAGYWIEVEVASQEYPAPPQSVAPSPAYEGYPQWLELVVGDSMNREVPEGSFVHVVDAIELGYAPASGDLVVVERRRDQGRLRERTVKQVEIGANGRVELWPRSHNPDWNKPLTLASDEEGVEVQVVGLVIGFYKSLR